MFNGASKFELVVGAFLSGLILVALATTLVKPGAQTPAVINSSGQAIGNSLYAAQGINQ